mmetsp:Transcript_486/g.1458  ORF Transcript_486/g.1458 Transcript_486/m.1458 type:complete len:207 (-) Transcript_486:80-700(-)
MGDLLPPESSDSESLDVADAPPPGGKLWEAGVSSSRRSSPGVERAEMASQRGEQSDTASQTSGSCCGRPGQEACGTESRPPVNPQEPFVAGLTAAASVCCCPWGSSPLPSLGGSRTISQAQGASAVSPGGSASLAAAAGGRAAPRGGHPSTSPARQARQAAQTCWTNTSVQLAARACALAVIIRNTSSRTSETRLGGGCTAFSSVM